MSVSYTPIESIPDIVCSLRTSFRKGITRSVSFRKQQLCEVMRFLEEQDEAIKHAIAQDLGKSRFEITLGETTAVIAECKYMLENIDKWMRATEVKKRFVVNAMSNTILRKEPKGVVLIISPWNYPLQLLLLPLVGAIAAGNCALLKPSEVSVHTAELIAQVLPRYLDSRAFRIVHGAVEETTAILEHKFNHIFYTGNGQVGRIVMAAASKHLTPVTLELGGKSPVIVARDADIKVSAKRIMWGKVFNAGQTCIAPDYILVDETVREELVKAMIASLKEFFGDKPHQSPDYGRLINTRQFDRLKAIIDAIDRNTIVHGGDMDPKTLYISPTIVSPVQPDDPHLMTEELFGPILPVVPFETIDEAIDIVRDGPEPLALYLFTKSKKTIEHVLSHTTSGGVSVNDTLMQAQEMNLPFGGVGESGMGTYHGKASFDTFTHERPVISQGFGMEGALKVRYAPYNTDKYNVLVGAITGFPSPFIPKCASIMRFMKSLWRVYN